MKELVGLPGDPELMRNSLILTGLALRTFSAVVSDCGFPVAWLVHAALATRSPLKGAGPEVTLKLALTLAPGATGSAKVFTISLPPETKAVHCLPGTARLKRRPAREAPVVLVKVTVVSCAEPGVKILIDR